MVAEVPLAHACRSVSFGLEHIGDGSFLWVQANIVSWEQYGFFLKHAPWVAAGHQGGTRGGADWIGRIEGGEHATFIGHAVNVWGFDVLGAEAAEVLVTLVIGEDDDEILSCGGRLLPRNGEW